MAKIVNPNAAGIDIASNIHYVAVSPEKCKEPVRNFQGFTRDLHELCKWLVSLEIETVAMESTGSYWYQLYTLLLDYNIEVYLVNAYHVKNVPGRKSDVQDAQWLQQLHESGYLRPCYQPDNKTRELRTYVRLRKQIIQEMTTETQRMQKALVSMNIKLHDVISDIHGKTGANIINAILNGVRDPEDLAQYKVSNLKCNKETLIKSLEGNWRDEHIFCLKLAKQKYSELEHHLHQVDLESERVVKLMTNEDVEAKEIKKQRSRLKQPKFNVSQHLYNVFGVDVTAIYGFKQTTALTVLAETGPNLKEKFPSVKQFLSWLNLVPDNKISGGKVLSSKVKKRRNKAGQAFREAANTLWNAKNPYGDHLRGKKAKDGAGPAVVATAKKIATIYYKMVTEKEEFDPHLLHGNRLNYIKDRLKSVEKINEKLQIELAYLQNLS